MQSARWFAGRHHVPIERNITAGITCIIGTIRPRSLHLLSHRVRMGRGCHAMDRLGVPALPRLAEDPGTVLAVGQELVAILEKTASLASAKGSKADDPSDSCERRRRRWSLLSNLYAAAFHRLGLESEQGSDEETIEAMTEVAFPLYGELRRLEILEGQGLLLQAMSWPRRSDVLQRLVRTLVDSPPGDWSVAALALSPLMRNTDWDAADVFPELLQGMHHPALVAPVLDLANFVTREGMLENHPAADAEDSLIQMLGGVVAQLGMLEEDPDASAMRCKASIGY